MCIRDSSGEVESVKEQILSDGSHAQYVTIVSDGKDTISDLVKKPEMCIRDRDMATS